MNKEASYLKTSIGTLKIIVKNDKLISINYCNNIIKQQNNMSFSETMQDVVKQLKEYFQKDRKNFNIPLKFSGTQFQRDIYKTLIEVEYGNTISYKELAERSGHSNAYQAVGTALKKNKIAIIIPCHRVIKSDGTLGNYNGGKWRKEKLLKLEE